MSRRLVPNVLWLVLVVGLALPADAALDVRVLSTTIPQNGKAFVDVVISGDGDLLDFYGYILEINRVGGPSLGTSLTFVAPASNPHVNDPAVSPDYVFDGVSIGFDGIVDTPTSFISADIATSNVTVSSQRLLSRIELQHFAASGVNAGNDVYLISSPFQVFFFDDGGVDIAPAPFTFTAGTVTVEATAVPEPSSIALLSCLAGGIAVAKRRRAKKLLMSAA